jgi:hypothetical protein
LHIDRSHRAWVLWTAALFMLALCGYLLYAFRFQNGPSGGSVPGLIFGGAGYILMLYAAFLSVRKKFSRWRIGRATTWMRGHLWLGLLSYPLIFFHAGLSFGHGLTFALMLILSVVIVTGVAGAALQHYMPRMITERVGRETIYYQIDRVQQDLAHEADSLLVSLFRKDTQYGLLVPAAEKTHANATTLVVLSEYSGDQLRKAYEDNIKPYLSHRGAYRHTLHDARRAKSFFADLRTLVPEPVRPVIDGLESICDEKRDLDRQSRFHRILHFWLLVHVPLAFLLLVLGGIHAVMALRYG